ncbi:hypothetical protein PIB30_094059 [Stylosanthes scabra]|uniref:CCHC-type domain-containing protein n=1 Tax=Stylosanthes scabra TaxID=79078 RepID=A0ABU6VZ33_9FABA|nr:hypothetical protein [Stylosanthes scabra]
MVSIHETYKYHIQPVPSEQYWSTINYLKTDAPIIKRPIGRPKVHNRKRDPVEDLIQGDKLKRTFRITCVKCGEKGHNYKTCKGAPVALNWKPKTRRGSKKTATASTSAQVEVNVSQSAPQTQLEGNQQPPSSNLSQTTAAVSIAQTPFRPPARVESKATTSTNFRAKQPIRRRAKRKSPPPSELPSASQSVPQPNQDMG